MEQSIAGIGKGNISVGRVARKVLLGCLLVEAGVLILDVAQHVAELWYFEHIKDLSNVVLENSFGTWLSVVLNFSVGGVALAVALGYRKLGQRPWKVLAWGGIALFFLYISLDDHLVLHERLSGGIGRVISTLGPGESFRFITYEWIYLFVPFFGLFGLFMLGFLFRELPETRHRAVLLLALILWVLAVGLDAWEGAGLPYEGMEAATGLARVKVRHTVMLAEEMMELLGSTLFLFLFLTRIRGLVASKPLCLHLEP